MNAPCARAEGAKTRSVHFTETDKCTLQLCEAYLYKVPVVLYLKNLWGFRGSPPRARPRSIARAYSFSPR